MRPLVVAALGCALTAGRVGGSEGPVGFSAGPKVAVGKDGVRIEFAASRATDVAVEILDAKGGTVRHLAAGVLGKNAPEPLGKGMAQSLVWDRKDDLGKDVPAGNYSVRVGLGLKPALGKIENFEPLNAGEVLGLAGLPGGGVCILNRGGYPDFLPRLIVLGRDGAYVRQIFPPPAGLEPEKSPGIRFFRRGDGCWVPILGEVMPRPKDSPPFCPMAAGGGSLAVVPFGASALRLFDTGTGALAAPVAADSLGQGRGKLSPRGLAMSPDGKWFYLTGIEADGRQIRALHAVYRLPSDGSVPLRPLAGDPGKPGKGETFFDTPIGLAADKDGNILVGDSGNDRVAVFSADGRFLRAVEVRSPVFVGAMPGGGFVALSAGAPPSPARTFPAGGARLLRFGADGRQLAGEDLKTPRGVGKLCATGLAVDASKDPAIVWLSLAGEAGETGAGALLRWECRGTGLAALDPIVTSYRRPQTKGPY
ncbi:MAG: hypothetical protein N3A38_14340, partial [Planctomycetota bacterium]|nr:hypothetical protein [Planctomycetota bacterium]